MWVNNLMYYTNGSYMGYIQYLQSNGQISVVSSSFRHRSHVTLEVTVKLKGYVLDTQERWEAGCHLDVLLEVRING